MENGRLRLIHHQNRLTCQQLISKYIEYHDVNFVYNQKYDISNQLSASCIC